MARPPVPIDIARGHRTIAEKKARLRREADLITGSALQEWSEVRENKVAHTRFTKIKNLLASIGKDDAMLEPIINRYCLIIAECYDLETKRESLNNDLDELSEHRSEMDFVSYISKKSDINNLILKCDLILQTKRKMLLDIEKESGMTMLSQLRTTTKKPKEEKHDDSGAMFG
jgi:hypothetical protein